ncbi:MAG: squalene synthase HpnC [Rhodospirillales bacterium]|jgi:squalene synthase HpnC|nr:squalene synthase HpnC [Rhodospirillales bacterium]
MTVANPPAVETPSGKDTEYENFPVGSWLLPTPLRPHVAVFYSFARAADDIADAPHLLPQEKLDRLSGFEGALRGEGPDEAAFTKAHAMARSLEATGVTQAHCLDLLKAFKQDATKQRYADWDGLMAYCQLSAAPVGRYLLDLHGGSLLGYGPSDALCNALQILNHLQDCKEDYLTLDRIYLPQDWFDREGAKIGDLAAPAANPPMRRVLDATLVGVDRLLAQAGPLPSGLISRRLAMESGATLRIAGVLSARLRRQDPLGHRVKLGKADYIWNCTLGSLGALLRGRAG